MLPGSPFAGAQRASPATHQVNSPAARTTAALALAAVLIGLLHALTRVYVTSDDALISLRYAWNLANGYGPVYNPFGTPVEGFSNPAWTALCAAAIRAGMDPVHTIKLFGLASFAAAIVVAGRLTKRLRTEPLFAPAAAAGLLAASPFAAFWAVGGLETAFHAMLVTLAVGSSMRAVQTGRTGLAPVAWLLVAVSRPEGALVGGVTFLVYWGLQRFRIAEIPRWVFAFGLPALCLLAARYIYFGSLTPNTYAAKVAFNAKGFAAGAHQFSLFLNEGAWILLLPAVLALFLSEGRRAGGARAIAWTAFAAQAGFVIAVSGDFMPAYRFMMPVYPVLCVLAADGLATIAARFAGNRAYAAGAVATLVMCAGVYVAENASIAQHPLRFWLQHDRGWTEYLGRTDFEGTWLEAHQEVGMYVRRRAKPFDVMAVTEAGAIPYYAGVRTVDMLGLNDAFVSKTKSTGREESMAAEQRAAGDPWRLSRSRTQDVVLYVLKHEPQWIVIDGRFDETTGGFTARLPIARALVESIGFANYQPVFARRVYDGDELGLGPDRIDIVFEKRGRRRRAHLKEQPFVLPTKTR